MDFGFQSCSPLEQCRVELFWSAADDSMTISIIFAADGGLMQRQLGVQDSGVAALWTESPMCLSTDLLSPADSCISHADWFRVTATTPDASTTFDYNLGGGVHPSAGIEIALREMAARGLGEVIDAGYSPQ